MSIPIGSAMSFRGDLFCKERSGTVSSRAHRFYNEKKGALAATPEGSFVMCFSIWLFPYRPMALAIIWFARVKSAMQAPASSCARILGSPF